MRQASYKVSEVELFVQEVVTFHESVESLAATEIRQVLRVGVGEDIVEDLMWEVK